MAKFVKLKCFPSFFCKVNKLTSFICEILMPGIRHALFFSKMVNKNNMFCQSIFLLPVFFLLVQLNALFCSVPKYNLRSVSSVLLLFIQNEYFLC